MYNWAIQELLLVDLGKTQYTHDDEGLYFCIEGCLISSNEFPNHL